MKKYRNFIWDHIEAFEGFGISWMDRSKNKMADLLANIATKTSDASFSGVSTIEMKSRPSIPDNVESR